MSAVGGLLLRLLSFLFSLSFWSSFLVLYLFNHRELIKRKVKPKKEPLAKFPFFVFLFNSCYYSSLGPV